FSILGGIEVFGFNGVVLGPLIFILFFTSVELYHQVYSVGRERGATNSAGRDMRRQSEGRRRSARVSGRAGLRRGSRSRR
ncbi:MAG TPA: hypothetical protein VMC79_11030, partial [Rectinemataceae bacterium]|nr:hypothetical protein [Rectinemataceae bacterium]